VSGIAQEDWHQTPSVVREFVCEQQQRLARLEKRLEQLEAQLTQNSTNSSKPPSSDNPYQKPKPGAQPGAASPGPQQAKGKAGGKQGHPGHGPQLVPPTAEKHIQPGPCRCGSTDFTDLGVYHTHQQIELPEIQMGVTHLLLHASRCQACGTTSKGHLSPEVRSGYGPRWSALIAELVGMYGTSRTTVQTFCASVLHVPIRLGAIQKVLARASAAIAPHYEAIGQQAREAELNHLDETPWYQGGQLQLQWLWVMANPRVAFFLIHKHRSKEAFQELMGGWMGILVSDGYVGYRKWVGLRQTCLAHWIRRAKGLAARSDPELARCGRWGRDELQRLVHMAKVPPTEGEWRAFYARLSHVIARYEARPDEAGKLARHLHKELESLYLFRRHEGVAPTNNFAERMIRFAGLWRKRSQGTMSDTGNRWVERSLSLRQTCRLHHQSTYEVLVAALDSHFTGQPPDLAWLTQPCGGPQPLL